MIGALLTLCMFGCPQAPAAGPRSGGRAPLLPLVEVVRARSGTLPLAERLSGVVRARNQVAIRAEVTAPVVEVLVRAGDAVTQGQPLLRLRDTELRDQLRQAEATVRLEESTVRGAQAKVKEMEALVQRAKVLAGASAVSPLQTDMLVAQLDAARAAVDQAQARVDLASATLAERRTALQRTIIRAPVAGIVGRRTAEVGLLADPSTVLLEVGDVGNLIVDVPISDGMLAHLRVGHPALVTPPGGGEPLQGSLTRVPPFLAPGSFSTTGEIDVANPDGALYPGMFVTVDVQYGQSERATIVPTAALWRDAATGAWLAFTVAPSEDGTTTGPDAVHAVTSRNVEVLAMGRNTVGVRGISEGEHVVTLGQHLLPTTGTASVRMRTSTWDHVLRLQGGHKEDLLRGFLATQQRYARTRGATPPTTDEFIRDAKDIPAEDRR